MKKQVHFYLHESTIQQLAKFAEDYAMSKSSALSMILSEYFRDKPQYQKESLNETFKINADKIVWIQYPVKYSPCYKNTVYER